ncbi:hypothetical protein WDW89_20735 [Deltaproteobacteria bacterium TL4]
MKKPSSRFTPESVILPEGIRPLSSKSIESLVEELTSLRAGHEEFDSISVDNAIRFCEKLDLAFEDMPPEARELLIQNYEFFESQYQLTLFLKFIFHGKLENKEIVFRHLFKKLYASYSVSKCILATKTLFEDQTMEEQVEYELKALIDTITQSFIEMLPPSLLASKEPRSLLWLNQIIAQEGAIFIEDEISYGQFVRGFTDLLYNIISHEKLPFYLKWRDEYLKYWLVTILREEDHLQGKLIPELSQLKAEIYTRYISWTKISKRLNANLRHKDTFDSDMTQRAETLLLGRLPSQILAEIILKIREMMQREECEEVDLGFEDRYVSENRMYAHIIDAVKQDTLKIAPEAASWLENMVNSMKQMFHLPQDLPGAENHEILLKERIFPERFIAPVSTSKPGFGRHFPEDYDVQIPKYFRVFFSTYRQSVNVEFDLFVRELLDYYEQTQPNILTQTLHQHTLPKTGNKLEFIEKNMVLPLSGQNLLMLGSTCFMRPGETNWSSAEPQSYFLFFTPLKTTPPTETLKYNNKVYHKISLDQLGLHKKEIFSGFLEILDSLPDSHRSKEPMQKLIQTCHENRDS